ncbi:MAG: RNA polymerase Rpb4 family protein [Candidatus Verstraetearchaeota archaeon]|jgi:DNA-directed RNA polymerase subunit F|nr:RNA polymerase Rpb4 family protein [Candidatus Verstraetearchaeota archaeon]
MPKEIIKEKILTYSQVKKLLEEREKEGGLNYLQKITYEYVSKLSKLDADKAEELMKKLEMEGISPIVAAQIVNIMPKTIDELRTILSTENKIFLPSDLERVLSIINSFRQ